MLTPLDIQNKEFKRAFRGYKETEVDIFLDEIILDYEKVYKENIELKDKITMLTDQLKQYDNLEDTLKNTLIVAQSTAEEVTTTARKKAELIISEAESQSKGIIQNANEEVRNIRKEYEELKKEVFVFTTRFKSLIESQLTTMDEYYRRIDKNNSNTNVTDKEIAVSSELEEDKGMEE
ncbi:DivIVA domain-containing protein [Sporanaerobacter sp. PP17-6a]|jgi:cell division initiation protein|uniref:DivIVA domain-containing protein n=1 Tax=Sporanaerobacter sp. PP17-6a TaxID=1891289 RepID=UPI00089FE614|nr:DivIVA domain-containing protein [Sporanaerobacter sp. PP17-6a]SCL83502.1 Minicell-associated protein DivIVA [Sporanaerobacter sp. PP17-6a]